MINLPACPPAVSVHGAAATAPPRRAVDTMAQSGLRPASDISFKVTRMTG